MYAKKFIACIKVNGQILREKGEQVFLPFGSEYTLMFKNEHTRKVQIGVSIDGTDVLFGKVLLVEPGATTDLKGFVRTAHESKENRVFKFIEKTDQISDFRGDKVEDGLVKITYQFEREPFQHIVPPTVVRHDHHYYDHFHRGTPYTPTPWTPQMFGSNVSRHDGAPCSDYTIPEAMPASTSRGVTKESRTTKGILRGATTQSVNATFSGSSASVAPTSFNDAGITVEGQETGQSFRNGYIGSLEDVKHTMIFQLKGVSANFKVVEPITTQQKKTCTTCGKKLKGHFEYCPNDGTFLRD